MPRVGIREVAQAADVAQGTVSHYLNHPDRVSAEKAARIKSAMDRLGFVRNNAARQLRLGHSFTIAYIVPDVSNPFFATIAEGVEARAAEAGLSVFLANSNRDTAREESYLDLFQEFGVRGMLVASPRPIEERLAAIRAHGTPSVLVGQLAASPDQPSVSIDDVSGGRLAAEHLISIGRRRIAFVGGPLGVRQVADRLQGASNAIRAAGGTTLEVIDVVSRVMSEGHDVGAAILARQADQRPDAVFAANDLLAIGIVQTLVTGGLRVPEDIAVVGYDDIEYAESSLVPLTSVRPPHEEFGTSAVELLLRAMDASQPSESGPASPSAAVSSSVTVSPSAQMQLVFPPDLVVRQSTVGA